MLYAVGQGALAVECRSNDTFILSMLSSLCHLKTQCKILTERSFLKTLGRNKSFYYVGKLFHSSLNIRWWLQCSRCCP